MHSPLPPKSGATPGSRRRKGSRSRKSNENAAPRGSNVPTPNRFGFKKRLGSVAATPPATLGQLDEAALAAPVDLVGLAGGVLGDLDGYARIIRTRPVASQYDFKARISEMTDMHKQVKEALKEMVKRGRELGPLFAPAQEEINARLLSMASDLGTIHAAHARSHAALEAATARGESLDHLSKGLRAELDATSASEARLKQRSAEEGVRADAAEASLASCEEQLRTMTALAEEREQQRDAQEEAAAGTARRAEEAAEEAAAAQAALEERLATACAEAADTQARLQSALDASTARAAELETALRSLEAGHGTLSAAHEELRAGHAATCETLAVAEATLTRVQAELESTATQLAQKDADLRASITSVMQIQADNAAQVRNERERGEKLEEEVRGLRETQGQLMGDNQAAALEVERQQGEINSLNGRLGESASALQRAEADRDLNAARAAEQAAALQLKQSELDKVASELGETREGLASARALLDSQTEHGAKMEQERRTLEVEYRSYKEHHGSSNAQQMEAITELKLTVDNLSRQVESKTQEVVVKETQSEAQTAYIDSLRQKLLDAEAQRRALHNAVQELKGNIRVFCRLRPPPADELSAIQPVDVGQLRVSHGAETYDFNFDRVFRPDTTQQAVFAEVDGLVQSALDGYKVCIFAYGQTGSGKTHTMQGSNDPDSWGLIPRSLRKILRESESMRRDGWAWTLRASFLEVYNEQLRDLLYGEAGDPPKLTIMHDDAWGTVVNNVSTYEVTSMEQINLLMAKAAKQRAVGYTDMNAASSRSHSIFALYLTGVNEALGSELHGALHLVDLAGSERLDRSGATGERLKETQSINKSLSSLATVFSAKAARQAHVPFRDSKLTYLMEPCLSGQGKTLMVVNVAPEESNSHETLCSLRFANQVSQCDTGGKPKRSAKPAGSAATVPNPQRSSVRDSAASARNSERNSAAQRDWSKPGGVPTRKASTVPSGSRRPAK